METQGVIKYRMGGFLAAAAMIGFLAAFAVIALRQIPAANKDFFNMSLIALISCVNIAFGYYLGSSQGSARKTEISASSSDQSGHIRVGALSLSLLMAVSCMVACTTVTTVDENGAIIDQETHADTEKLLAGAKLIARKAGKYVGLNNPGVASSATTGYAVIKGMDGDEFRDRFLDRLQSYIDSEGISGSEELRSDASDLLDLFGYDIDLTSIDIEFLQRFEVASIKAVAEAFLEGLALAV